LQYWGSSNTHQHWFAIWLQLGQKFFNVAFCSYLHLQYFSWAAVPGGRITNATPAQSPIVGMQLITHYSKMKKITLLFIITSLFSCKTIKVTEKGVLKSSKYNFEEYNKSVQESNLSSDEKVYMTSVLTNLINTDKEEILKNEFLTIRRKFFQPNDTIKLEYFEFEPTIFTKTGMFFLGNASSVTANFSELEKLSIETKSKLYVLNYRGYGKSDGTPSFNSLFLDNQSFLNFIENNNYKLNFVIGHSFGTISATYLAIDNKIKNLVLLAPVSNSKDFLATNKKRMTKGIKFIMRPFLKITTDNDLLSISNVEKIKSYTGHLIILHSVDDEWLPFKMGKDVFKNCISINKEFIKVETGGHFAAFEIINWTKITESLK
jgi:esterase/lipase